MPKVDIVLLGRAVRESGYKQNYIAERCGINNRSFSRILHGGQTLSADVFVGICSTIGAPMEAFVCETERDTEVSRPPD